jgi:hypothetical protein
MNAPPVVFYAEGQANELGHERLERLGTVGEAREAAVDGGEGFLASGTPVRLKRGDQRAIVVGTDAWSVRLGRARCAAWISDMAKTMAAGWR